MVLKRSPATHFVIFCALVMVLGICIVSSAEPPQSSMAKSTAGVEVLSDTEGVNFSAYLQSAIHTVKENWYGLVPPAARALKMAKGDVIIEFVILKNGKRAGMKLIENSADVQMGNAAWHAIEDSRFAPLPVGFRGQYLSLRLHFSYNPAKPNDLVLQYKE